MSGEILSIKTVKDYISLENHLKVLSEIQVQLDEGQNLADIIWTMELDGSISKGLIPAVVHTLLIEKMQYSCLSFNLSARASNWNEIHNSVKTWNQFDTVIAYYHPQLDVSLINPSNKDHWSRIESLAPYELMVVFTKALNPSQQEKEVEFLADFKAISNGNYAENEKQYQSTEIEPPKHQPRVSEPGEGEEKAEAAEEVSVEKAEEPQTEISPSDTKKRRITPKYGVQVTNELFHNGNVEAWRNIIESYEKKHFGSTILLYHNDQRIKHISALFKWGKVKVGDSIYFSIVGEDIKDVAKLKKYLYQGASPSYIYFIKKDVNVTLRLF